MDVHLHGACMGKLVGPAGGGGGGGGAGHGISTQFRILPSALPTESIITDADRVSAAGHFPSMSLRVATPTPHRTFSPEPFKISDDFISSASTSPVQDAASSYLLHDIPAGFRRHSLGSGSPGSTSPKLVDKKPAARLEDGDIPEERAELGKETGPFSGGLLQIF
ncbi:hypothetical protein R1sor_003684 [Riccia sorocarpa]|uniref:Uncharacterized protein n=1 Tax=Riccia sorocarpa TaxID=122646 RepID=A0ABD3H537_9MARC